MARHRLLMTWEPPRACSPGWFFTVEADGLSERSLVRRRSRWGAFGLARALTRRGVRVTVLLWRLWPTGSITPWREWESDGRRLRRCP